ncbi:hypothetical protein SUNI508_05436 [Seiridium unicorne]|uniref:Molybdate-anion transporter n=1 Tax=Seiridium unicorne TaxID=138068 RepID=A0ABR2V4I4_9PEZI
MAIDIYWIGLLFLTPCVALVLGRGLLLQPFRGKRLEVSVITQHDAEAGRFRRSFLQVYLLVMGSEWLQGPYMYSLLRDEKQLAPSIVAILYTATYGAAAASAPWTGYLADKFGRRTACITFCAIHSLASISVLFDRVEILVLGRVLGGIGVTLLWTAFESWMISEHNSRKLGQSSIPLGAMFGVMTTANCITAIVAGVVAHCVVLTLGSKTNPFLLGLFLDACAVFLMLRTWNENHGISALSGVESRPGNPVGAKPWQRDIIESFRDSRILILSLTSCCFEGTIFLLMFYWPGALQAAHSPDQASGDDAVPYGVIFANFMATMVLGALLFGMLMHKWDGGTPDDSFLATVLLSGALLLAGISFLAAAFAKTELQFFCAFLVLEACNGMYVPSIAYQRGRVVNDCGRATIYGLMNMPLFIFVIAALLTTSKDGDDHQSMVFIFCAALLLVAAVTSFIGLCDPQSSKGLTELYSSDMPELDEKEGKEVHG